MLHSFNSSSIVLVRLIWEQYGRDTQIALYVSYTLHIFGSWRKKTSGWEQYKCQLFFFLSTCISERQKPLSCSVIFCVPLNSRKTSTSKEWIVMNYNSATPSSLSKTKCEYENQGRCRDFRRNISRIYKIFHILVPQDFLQNWWRD